MSAVDACDVGVEEWRFSVDKAALGAYLSPRVPLIVHGWFPKTSSFYMYSLYYSQSVISIL